MKNNKVLILILFLLPGALGGAFFLGSLRLPLLADAFRSVTSSVVRTGLAVYCRDATCGFADTSNKKLSSCDIYKEASPRRMVLLVFGQSNGANHGEGAYTSVSAVDNFNPQDGSCYQAADPLLGATGSGASPWPIMADKLISSETFEQILIVTVGVGGSKIEQWQEGGNLNHIITQAARSLKDAGIKPTHIAWHQGEANVNDSAELYTEAFASVLKSLRAKGLDAPVFPAIASLCGNLGSDEIRRAQASLAEKFPGVFLGANSDSLDRFVFRKSDNCHFSTLGMEKHAELWQNVFTRFKASDAGENNHPKL